MMWHAVAGCTGKASSEGCVSMSLCNSLSMSTGMGNIIGNDMAMGSRMGMSNSMGMDSSMVYSQDAEDPRLRWLVSSKWTSSLPVAESRAANSHTLP